MLFTLQAFLGQQAEEFKTLTPEKSKVRLAAILERVDSNQDGLVSVEELRVWIKNTGIAIVSCYPGESRF